MRTKVASGDSTNWKCPACGADNDISQKICDGCGDRRPKPTPSSVFPEVRKEALKPAKVEPKPEPKPKASSDDFEKPEKSLDDQLSLDVEEKLDEKLDEEIEEKPADVDDDELGQKVDDDFLGEEKHEEPLKDKDEEAFEAKEKWEPIPEPPPETTPETTPEASTKDFEIPSTPIAEPSPRVVGQHYHLTFINTPATSMIKAKVALDFEDFEVISIGRNPENLVVIPDAEVSRKHAQISLEGGRVMLSDLKSSNGTFVYDGKEFKRVTDSVEVKPNTIIKFGINTIVRLNSD